MDPDEPVTRPLSLRLQSGGKMSENSVTNQFCQWLRQQTEWTGALKGIKIQRIILLTSLGPRPHTRPLCLNRV